MSFQRCSRCNKVINSGDLFYRLTIKVFADFDGVINIRARNIDLKKEFEKVKSYPEELIEEEVYKEFDFILCPRCKEIYCANPLHLPLGNITSHDTE
jgi:phage FluMu protein Com